MEQTDRFEGKNFPSENLTVFNAGTPQRSAERLWVGAALVRVIMAP